MTAFFDPPELSLAERRQQQLRDANMCSALLRADPLLDGVTHINVYSRGQTALGRDLSNFATTPITLPNHGAFRCLEGYWHWLSTGCCHDAFRTVNGYHAKQLKKQHEKVPIDNFEAQFCAAIAAKLDQHPEITHQLCMCNLPLLHYYVYGHPPKVQVPLKYLWIIEGLELERVRRQAGQR